MPWVAAWTIKPKITGALHSTTRCRYCKRIQFMIQDPSAASHPLTVQLQSWCVMFDSTSFQRFFFCDSAPSLTDSELEDSVKVLLRTTAPLTSSMEPGCAGNSGERMDQEGHWQGRFWVFACCWPCSRRISQNQWCALFSPPIAVGVAFWMPGFQSNCQDEGRAAQFPGAGRSHKNLLQEN